MIPTNGIDHVMLLDSTKTLDDLRGEGSFSVGGVKNRRFLFPAQKTIDVCRKVVYGQHSEYQNLGSDNACRGQHILAPTQDFCVRDCRQW